MLSFMDYPTNIRARGIQIAHLAVPGKYKAIFPVKQIVSKNTLVFRTRSTNFRTKVRMKLALVFVSIALTYSAFATDSGYDYENPVALTSWTPAVQEKSFRGRLRDEIKERQTVLGVPIGVINFLTAIGGVSKGFTHRN